MNGEVMGVFVLRTAHEERERGRGWTYDSKVYASLINFSDTP